MKEFMQYIFGEGCAAKIAATLFYAYAGAFVSLLFQAVKRDPKSSNTPYHFSWNFLWSDNVKRILRSIIIIFISVRFSKEFFGVDATMYFAFLLGLGIDKISEFIKNKNDPFKK